MAKRIVLLYFSSYHFIYFIDRETDNQTYTQKQTDSFFHFSYLSSHMIIQWKYTRLLATVAKERREEFAFVNQEKLTNRLYRAQSVPPPLMVAMLE